jgi:plasmid maintenance system antidote protein VapI
MITLRSVNTMLEKKYRGKNSDKFPPLKKGENMQLIDYLKQEGISQAKFARKIKLSPAGVCRIIKGNRFPRPETILAIDFWTQGQVTHDDFYKQAQANKQSDVSKV